MIQNNYRYYTFNFSISPGKDKYKDFTIDKNAGQDTPFSNIVINNGEGIASIRVYLNGSNQGFKVGKGTIYNLTDVKISSIRIENLDNTNTADFEITVDNKLSQIDYLKMLVFGLNEVKK